MITSRRTADIVLLIVAAMAVFFLGVMTYAGAHAPISRSVAIDDCALVQLRDEPAVCR